MINVVDTALSTTIVITAVLLALATTFRRTGHQDLFPVPVTQELKGLGMLAIVFAHISYMLVTDNTFLYPLSIAAGVGVDLFLFMSGYAEEQLRKSIDIEHVAFLPKPFSVQELAEAVRKALSEDKKRG